MFLKRILSTVLSAVLLLSLLAGCTPLVSPTDPTEPTVPTVPTVPTTPTRPTEPTSPSTPTQPTVPTELTEPTRYDPAAPLAEFTQEMFDDIFFRYGPRRDLPDIEAMSLEVFGVFEDTYALLIRGGDVPPAPCWQTVNGLVFYYPDGNAMIWYKIFNPEPGTHLPVAFAYQDITAEQLKTVYDNYYSAYPELLPLAQTAASFGEDTKQDIIEALRHRTGEELDWNDTNDMGTLRLVYYCTVADKHIFRWITRWYSPAYAERDYQIGEYKFDFSQDFWLYVYDGNTLLTLNEAYEQGVFGDEELGMIYYYHYGSRPRG